MKIAHIGLRTLGKLGGGLATYIKEVVPILEEKGHKVTVYTIKGYDVGNSHGIRVKEKKSTRNRRIEMLSYGLSASLDAARSDVDLVHYHSAISATSSFLPRVMNKPTLLTLHGSGRFRKNWDEITLRVHKFIEEKGLRSIDKITVVTEGLRKYLKNHYDLESLYIPHGAKEVSNLSPSLIKRFGLKGQDYILHVGKLTQEKGADILINAYKNLPNQEKTKLVIAGGASLVSYLEDDYARILHKLSKNNPNIIFTGYVEGYLLSELFSNAIFFVSPSKIQALPLTVLEAMCYGTCVLSSDIDKTKEAYNHTVCFQNRDVDDLTRKMQFLLENENKKLEMVNSAREYVKKNHSWVRVAEEFENIYYAIANKGKEIKKKTEGSLILENG